MSTSITEESTNTFRVWARSLGNSCRLRVDGHENAEWLLGRLTKVFNNCGPINKWEGSSFCTFQVPYNNERSSRSALENMLAAISEIELMLQPEWEADSKEAGPTEP
jgi:hypothetical protein